MLLLHSLDAAIFGFVQRLLGECSDDSEMLRGVVSKRLRRAKKSGGRVKTRSGVGSPANVKLLEEIKRMSSGDTLRIGRLDKEGCGEGAVCCCGGYAEAVVFLRTVKLAKVLARSR